MAVTRESVLSTLADIAGPDGRPLSTSLAPSDVVVDGARVYLSIPVDRARAGEFEAMRAAAEARIAALPGVASALVSLTAERPAAQAAPSAATPKPTNNLVPGVRHVVAVASGKGGVGKSTTSANFALALAAEGARVGLLDADVFGPSVPKLFGLTGRGVEQRDQKLVPIEVAGIRVMSIGFLVDEEAPMIWRGPMVMGAVTQLLRDVDWGDLDVLVVDMPPGTGDTQLTLAQSVPLAGAVIVSTPQDLALIDARRGIAMFEKVGVPILGVVENMSYFVCPNCGTRHDVFAHGGARAEAARLGAPFLGEIPLSMPIREGSDGGRPVVATDPQGPLARPYRDIAVAILARLGGSDAAARPRPRIVVE